MTVALTYPGVYIRELPSDVRSITGVATSVTAFIGRTLRGPVNQPTPIRSFSDFERTFGGLWVDSLMSYSVRHFFLNGGGEALIVRVYRDGGDDGIATALLDATDVGDPLALRAASPGEWGNALIARVDHETIDKNDPGPVMFNLTIQETDPTSSGLVLGEEIHRNLSLDPGSSRYVTDVLDQESDLVRVDVRQAFPAARPSVTAPPHVSFGGGDHGQAIGDNEITDDGIPALDQADLFNLLCIPPYTGLTEVAPATWDAAAQYCRTRRAFLLIDPPRAWNSAGDIDDAAIIAHVVTRSDHAALFVPQIIAADPLRENRLFPFAPSGAIAGVIARTDSTRGVWKAPAGIEATVSGAQDLTIGFTDAQQGSVNPLGVNCLRTRRSVGRVVFGARTLAGADELASQWKYIPIRRLALYIEETLYRGTQWVVFEPNDEPLWAQIRLNIGAFMHGLFVQGAFQGTSARDAYLVKCDRETTTQTDIDRGVVNILVGFAPLKPAEFVIISIQQLAGQVQA